MSKKTFLVLLGFVFLFSFNIARASLLINEVMYDLSGSDSLNSKSREWVEIYNPDSSKVDIDATKWRFYDGSNNRTINNETNFSISAMSYVIFAGDKTTFLSDNPNFRGIVYDTGITNLSNTGATLKILDKDGNVVDSVTYTSSQGAAGDGNSLSKINGVWQGATPTPGVQNYTQPSVATSGSSSGTSTSTTSSPVQNTQNTTSSASTAKIKIVETPKIKTKISAKALVFMGIPLIFSASATGYSNEPLSYGKYFWNFGDGDSKETKVGDQTKFSHTFFYGGEYNVALEYFTNPYSLDPDATDKMTIRVVPTDVSISNVGDDKDFFVEISNNTSYDADLSGWILSSNGRRFTLPSNTIVEPKDKIILSPKVTGFSILDKSTLKLLSSQGDIIFDYSYPTPVDPIKNNNTQVKLSDVSPNQKVLQNNINEDNNLRKNKTTKKTLINNLPDDALEATAVKSDTGKTADFMYGVLGLFIFLGIGVGAVYYIRKHNRKSVSKATGEDFEILDE